MANVAGVLSHVGPQDGSMLQCLWETITTTNTAGTPLAYPAHADRSVQVVGTFGGGTLTMQGSNDGGTTWASLTDPQGNAVAFTAVGIEQITELTALIRPSLSGGDGTTDLDVYVLLRRPTEMRQ